MNSEMHRGEDLACKLFVSVVIAINQSVLNAISFDSLTLCCQEVQPCLSHYLSPDFTSLLLALLSLAPTCLQKVMWHELMESQIFYIRI